jgi:hypothetical protein
MMLSDVYDPIKVHHQVPRPLRVPLDSRSVYGIRWPKSWAASCSLRHPEFIRCLAVSIEL